MPARRGVTVRLPIWRGVWPGIPVREAGFTTGSDRHLPLAEFLCYAVRAELVTRPLLGEAGSKEVERFQPEPTGKLGVCWPTVVGGPHSSIQ